MLKLSDTVEKMNSNDYKERFKAEYEQLVIRFHGLCNMLHKWDLGQLDFEPTCPRSTYDMQVRIMSDYITMLEMRACVENIDLSYLTFNAE